MLPSTRPAVDCVSAGRLIRLRTRTRRTIRTANVASWTADRAVRRDVIGTSSVLLVRQPYHCCWNEVKQFFRCRPFLGRSGALLVHEFCDETKWFGKPCTQCFEVVSYQLSYHHT